MRRTPLKSPMLCRIVGTLGVIVLVLPALYVAAPSSVFAQGAGKEVKEKPIPPGLDVFNLNLGQWIAFSERKNFEVLGHSYFKGPCYRHRLKQTGRARASTRRGFTTASRILADTHQLSSES